MPSGPRAGAFRRVSCALAVILCLILACGTAEGAPAVPKPTPGKGQDVTPDKADASTSFGEVIELPVVGDGAATRSAGVGDDEDALNCYGAQYPKERSGYGTCDPPSATRSASSEGGDNLGPDDPSKYLSIDEAKARALKELQAAKADPLAAFAKWLKDNKKSYAADSELGKLVFAYFLKFIDRSITHNSNPDSLYAMGLTSELDRSVLFGRSDSARRRRALDEEATTGGSPWGVLGDEPDAPEMEPFGMGSLSGAKTCSTSAADNRNGLQASKQQGGCGSCWAFAVAAAVEAQGFTAGQAKVPYLSTQQLVDCAVSSQVYPGYTNDGCGGGYTSVTLEYVKKEGLLFESEYPYELENFEEGDPIRKTCRAALKVNKKRYYIPSYQRVTSDEDVMKDEMCMRGARAIIIAIGACDSLQNYRGGIYDDYECEPNEQNGHLITIVGYGTATVNGKSVPYWLVRNSWGANWGDPSYPGYVRIKRGDGLIGLDRFPYRIATPYALDFSKCYTSTAWQDGVFRAWKGTSWGNYWAVAATAACNKYGFSYNYGDKLTAEQSAVTACTNGFGVPCAVMQSGQAECTDTEYIASLKLWVESKSSNGQIYAVATNGTCGTAYARRSTTSDWAYVTGVTEDCDAAMAEDFGTTAANPCGVVLKGQKGKTTYICTDASKWADAKADAIANTWWGYAWVVVADPGCGNRWYSYNWPTVDEALEAKSNLDECNSAAAETWGPDSCSVVESGVAECTDSSKWQSFVDLAKGNTDPGKAWGVWIDKTCSFKWYAYNYESLDDLFENSDGYNECNQAAMDKGGSDYSCEAVAWGVELVE